MDTSEFYEVLGRLALFPHTCRYPQTLAVNLISLVWHTEQFDINTVLHQRLYCATPIVLGRESWPVRGTCLADVQWESCLSSLELPLMSWLYLLWMWPVGLGGTLFSLFFRKMGKREHCYMLLRCFITQPCFKYIHNFLPALSAVSLRLHDAACSLNVLQQTFEAFTVQSSLTVYYIDAFWRQLNVRLKWDENVCTPNHLDLD